MLSPFDSDVLPLTDAMSTLGISYFDLGLVVCDGARWSTFVVCFFAVDLEAELDGFS